MNASDAITTLPLSTARATALVLQVPTGQFGAHCKTLGKQNWKNRFAQVYMVRAPDWTEEEFQILLDNHNLSDEELADILKARTSGAVGVVRGGLHSFHRGGDISGLSKMMVRELEDGRSLITCPKCGVEF